MSGAGEHHGVWVIAEQSAGRIQRVTHELLNRARPLAGKRDTELTAAVLGGHVSSEDLRELIDRGADRVLSVEATELTEFQVEPYAACLVHLIREQRPEIVLAGATSTGRTLMPYVAVRLGTGLTADCTELDIEPETGKLLQTRPAVGGNILATIKTATFPQMCTVRPHSMPSAPREKRSGHIERFDPPQSMLTSRVRRLGFVSNASKHPLQEAEAVVAAGRGIRKGENIYVVEELAQSLAAALGASRDVIDRGWLPYPHQVGLSGRTVSPRLYVAVGVSGAIQHLAGMQTSQTIVAINSDPEAQIFRVSDFGIVGDLFEVVPALARAIRRARGNT